MDDLLLRGMWVFVSSAVSVEYLRRRVKVHTMRENGIGVFEIAETLDISVDLVMLYLRQTKPKLLRYDNFSWTDQAACQGMDTGQFFPERTGIKGAAIKRDAIRLCGRCPVRDQCRRTALAGMERAGVWGGTDFSKVQYQFDEASGRVLARSKGGSFSAVS